MKKLLTITTAILALSSANVMAADNQRTQTNNNQTTNSTAGKTIDDAKIVTVVNGNLVKDKDLSALKINVDSTQGNVVLRGTAPSISSKARAETIAKSTEGVVSVDNRLEVSDTRNDSRNDSKNDNRNDNRSDMRNDRNDSMKSSNNNSDSVKNKARDTTNTVGAKIDDAAINVAVNSSLVGDSELSALKINVDVKNGTVLLKGNAPNLAAKNRATQLAKSVEGVSSVNNQLMIQK